MRDSKSVSQLCAVVYSPHFAYERQGEDMRTFQAEYFQVPVSTSSFSTSMHHVLLPRNIHNLCKPKQITQGPMGAFNNSRHQCSWIRQEGRKVMSHPMNNQASSGCLLLCALYLCEPEFSDMGPLGSAQLPFTIIER